MNAVNWLTVKFDEGLRMLAFGLHQSMEFTRVHATPCGLGQAEQDEWETCTVEPAYCWLDTSL